MASEAEALGLEAMADAGYAGLQKAEADDELMAALEHLEATAAASKLARRSDGRRMGPPLAQNSP